MTYKTVTELANELNISRQAIQKRIKKLPSDKQPKKVDGKYRLSEEVVNQILTEQQLDKGVTTNNDNPVTTELSTDNPNVLTIITEDKKQLYKIISNLEKRLEESQLLLNQQQQLTLQSNKQIDKLQLQLESKEQTSTDEPDLDSSMFKESIEEQQQRLKQELVLSQSENEALKEQVAELNQLPKKSFWQRLFNQ